MEDGAESAGAEATQMLSAYVRGDARAAERLMPIVYDELKRVAGRFMRGERGDHSLQPTAIVHEAYLQLIDIDQIDWNGRSHFVAMAARAMRRVLVDHARGRDAQKRGGALQRVELSDRGESGSVEPIDILALEEALEELSTLDERQARVIELRFLGGLTLDETAAACGVSRDTVKLDWRMARAWLNRRLSSAEEGA